jgi:hypothetical protein
MTDPNTQAAENARVTAPAQTTPQTVRVLSIDAWRDGPGWTWNNWYSVASAPLSLCDAKPRAILQWFRESGILSQYSRGRCAIEDDGYNVVIVSRGTREPLFALEYGAVQS